MKFGLAEMIRHEKSFDEFFVPFLKKYATRCHLGNPLSNDFKKSDIYRLVFEIIGYTILDHALL